MKRVMSFTAYITSLLSLIVGIYILVPLEAQADTQYNALAAVNFAVSHYTDYKYSYDNYPNGACNVFVYDCIKAGGLPVAYGGVEALRNNLKQFGTEYLVNIRNGSFLYGADNPNCSIGDPVFYYCNKCNSYQHTCMITSQDRDGKFRMTQVSPPVPSQEYQYDEYWNYSSCHSFDDMTVSVIHLDGSSITTTTPEITGAVTKCSTTGYEVTCTASDITGVVQLSIGTWNDAIGVSNAQWQTFNISGNNVSHTFKINIADFGNRQNTVYHSNVYAYNVNGNPSKAFRAADILIETEKPVITEARIENITKTSYDVICKARDNGTVHRFAIGTWHNNMSVDDAVWQTSDTFVNEARFTVNISSFGNAQNVVYHTNVYAIDLCGNWSQSARAGDPMIETVAPSVIQCDAINITDSGYDVVVTATDNSCLKKLKIGTWHSGIPVDQAQWLEVSAEGQSNFSHTFHVDIADFDYAQNVTYYTNAYAWDLCGNISPALMSQYVLINEKVEPDFILPSGTVFVEEYAFSGCAFTYVKLSEETTTLGDGAFLDCPNLKHVYLSENTVIIGRDVFPDNITIHGKEGTYAETYAHEHGLDFIAE